jgi:hypothetical protein
MINPSDDDIGRKVVYTTIWNDTREEGVITSFNNHFVFVRYGSDINSKATRREDLEWMYDAAYSS